MHAWQLPYSWCGGGGALERWTCYHYYCNVAQLTAYTESTALSEIWMLLPPQNQSNPSYVGRWVKVKVIVHTKTWWISTSPRDMPHFAATHSLLCSCYFFWPCPSSSVTYFIKQSEIISVVVVGEVDHAPGVHIVLTDPVQPFVAVRDATSLHLLLLLLGWHGGWNYKENNNAYFIVLFIFSSSRSVLN